MRTSSSVFAPCKFAARLSRARKVLFLITGESIHSAVAAWRAGKDIPARAIMPAAGVGVLVDGALLVPLPN